MTPLINTKVQYIRQIFPVFLICGGIFLCFLQSNSFAAEEDGGWGQSSTNSSPEETDGEWHQTVIRDNDPVVEKLKSFPSIGSIVFDPSSSQTIYALNHDTIFKSIDGGENWSNLKLAQQVYQLMIDQTNSNILYATTQLGFYKSSNGGLNWQAKNNGLKEKGYYARLVAANWDNNTIYTILQNGYLYKSTDLAEHWLEIRPMNAEASMHLYSSILPISQTVETLYLSSNMGVHKLHDQKWQLLNKGFKVLNDSTTPPIKLIKSDPSNPDILYAISYDGLYKTTNGGKDWLPINSGFKAIDSSIIIHSLAIDPEHTETIYAGLATGLYKSVDGGQHWFLQDKGIAKKDWKKQMQQVQTKIPPNADTSSLNMHTSLAIAIDPHQPNTLLVGTDLGFYKTTDRGQNWRKLSDAGLSLE